MPLVNVILPAGNSYTTVEAAPQQQETTQVVTTVEHQTVHETDELEVANVFDAVHDEAFDEADVSVADPYARSKQNLDAMPHLVNGSKFVKRDHQNDNDTTTDSSSISMYRTVYIEPPPNKPAGFPSPTMFTSGSVCVCGEGSFAYIPYSISGQQKRNTKYIFGRAEEIGDRSNDNDGLMMQLEETIIGESGINIGEEIQVLHRVHMCPNPSDPVLKIESQRGYNSDFIQIYEQNAAEPSRPENLVFRVDGGGRIASNQISGIFDRLDSLESRLEATLDSLGILKDQVEEIRRAAAPHILRIPAGDWSLPYN